MERAREIEACSHFVDAALELAVKSLLHSKLLSRATRLQVFTTIVRPGRSHLRL